MDQRAFRRRRSMHMHSYGAGTHTQISSECSRVARRWPRPLVRRPRRSRHMQHGPRNPGRPTTRPAEPPWSGERHLGRGGIGCCAWRILSLSLLPGRLDPTSPSATPQLLARPASLHAHPSSVHAPIHARCSEVLVNGSAPVSIPCFGLAIVQADVWAAPQ